MELKNKSIEEVVGLIQPESVLATIRTFRPVPRVSDNSSSSYTQVAPFSVGQTKSIHRAPQPPSYPSNSLPIHYADLLINTGKDSTSTLPEAVPSFYCNMDIEIPRSSPPLPLTCKCSLQPIILYIWIVHLFCVQLVCMYSRLRLIRSCLIGALLAGRNSSHK